MKYIIFDIDGVLADPSHRLQYLKDKNYEKFYSDEEIAKDEVVKQGVKLVQKLAHRNNGSVILITGRNETCLEATERWLWGKAEVYAPLYMRPKNDYRPTHEVKEDLIKKHIGFENILFAFDDDPKIAEMYKRNGVVCYVPNEGKK